MTINGSYGAITDLLERTTSRTASPVAEADGAKRAIDASEAKRVLLRMTVVIDCEIYADPIRIPLKNTSTPPTTTWNAAARNGVSM